jgi:phosphatidylserine/phosphatidylglycerophosphate/cardiolipin synthase-like enzyme/uncharacterized membrane protein YdjX (TVP38/TMEM64 family)
MGRSMPAVSVSSLERLHGASDGELLVEGQTCWRKLPAERASLLIDGAAYFGALRRALEQARHSIFILGWDIRSDLVLDPDQSDEPLRLLLDRLARTRSGLHVRLLIWDWLPLYALDRQPLPALHLGLRTHDHVHFALDSRHPPAGCHHEKLVVIDGRLAFVGGIDLNAGRWDTPAHLPHEPRRAPPGDRRPPLHDHMLMVEGEVAASVEQLAIERWRCATGEAVEPTTAPSPGLWPAHIQPQFRDIEVGISRTRPSWEGRPGCREIESLWLAAIASARTSIYIENQYLTADRVGDALAARLAEPDGPEVIIVTPKACEGVLETAVMDIGRARFVRRLRQAAPRDRLRVLTLERELAGERAAINVHGKLLIVDDRLLFLGSANLANRSMGLDGECNLAIEAREPQTVARSRIAEIRATLLAEHLERPVHEVQAALAQHAARVVPVIEALGPGRFRNLRLRLSPLVRQIAAPARLADLDEPLTAGHIAEHIAQAPQRRRLRDIFARFGIVLLVLAGLALLAGLARQIDRTWVESAFNIAQAYAGSPLGAALVVGVFVVASQLLVPVTLLIALTGAAMGPWLGFVYSMVGALAAAVVTFAIGRVIGRERLRRWAGRRLSAVSTALGRRGLIAMALIRLVPVAPFTVVNLVAGVSEIRLRDFTLGSAIGLLPGLVLASLLGDQLGQWLRQPNAAGLALLLGCVIMIIVLARLVEGWSRARATS